MKLKLTVGYRLTRKNDIEIDEADPITTYDYAGEPRFEISIDRKGELEVRAINGRLLIKPQAGNDVIIFGD